MATQSKQRAGRKYSVDSSGITSLKREYVVIQDDVMAANGEAVSFNGVPAIGSAHPNFPGLIVASYDVEEGSGADKKTLKVTANYAPRTTETSGSGTEAISYEVDEWGWDGSTDEKELTEGVDGTPVLNSAGDPFESVPNVPVPAPIFTKVMKFKQRQSGAMSFNCKVNSGAITIGGMSCAVGTLLCTVFEKRLIGDPVWKYQYTVQLKFKSNPVKIAGDGTATDIGWDVAITDAGMRAKTSVGDGEEIRLIRRIDKETGKMCTVTSPALLNGNGYVRSETANDEVYNFRFQAHERASFPSWFYSEPA